MYDVRACMRMWILTKKICVRRRRTFCCFTVNAASLRVFSFLSQFYVYIWERCSHHLISTNTFSNRVCVQFAEHKHSMMMKKKTKNIYEIMLFRFVCTFCRSIKKWWKKYSTWRSSSSRNIDFEGDRTSTNFFLFNKKCECVQTKWTTERKKRESFETFFGWNFVLPARSKLGEPKRAEPK